LEWIDMNADGVESGFDPAGPPLAPDDEPVPPRPRRRDMLAGLGVVDHHHDVMPSHAVRLSA
jgi:hypothetical protein